MTTLTLDFMQQLNPPQKEAVLHTEGPLLILAGAGSGKTRVITSRIAHLIHQGVAPWHILAVTFTNKAAEEMQRRVADLTEGRGSGVLLSTFHKFCSQLLRREGQAIGVSPHYIIYDDQDQKDLLKECLVELELDEKKFKPPVLASLISRAKDELIDAKSYEIHALTANDPFRETMTSIYHLYQKKLVASGALDFGDLILKSVELLHEQAAVREKYQNRFQYILVDEYQDTNRAQYVLMKILAAKYRNLCVVGDDDQCVYVWRGADIRNILEFEKEYPETKVIKLEQNYRSSAAILAAAWNVVKNNQNRKDKKLWTAKPAGEPVTATEFQDDREESHAIASTLRTMTQQGDVRFSDFSIFYRINAQSRVFEDSLRRLEIPYKIIGSMRFYERSEIKNVLAYLRVVVNPNDSLSLKRIFNVPTRHLSKNTMEAFVQLAQEQNLSLFEALGRAAELTMLTPRARAAATAFRDLLLKLMAERDRFSAMEMTRRVLEETGYLRGLEQEQDDEAQTRAQNIREFLNAVEEYEERSPDHSLAGFLEQVSLVADSDEIETGPNYVTLMTVHLAKGLEFDHVFLTGMEEGLFPIGSETNFDPEELEEERRLCYVGMTRAKKTLSITWCSSRRLFGQSRWNSPSRFIEEAGLQTSTEGRGRSAEPKRSDSTSAHPGLLSTQDSAPSTAFAVGMRVRHADFGTGKIIEKSGAGESLKVMVLFDSGHWKKLLVKYANLERL